MNLDEPPRSSTHGAPKYSFGKTQNGRVRGGKIHRADVREMRRWAVREGFGMSAAAQARALQLRYPGLSTRTIEQILGNASWYDPTYDREQPHPEWAEIPTALALLLILRQMYTPVRSSLEVDVLQEPGLPQGAEAVLDGPAVEAA